MAALVWWFWPADFSPLNDPEPIFVFTGALVVWLMTEFKTSEEFSLPEISDNDVSVARDLLRLHSEEFRVLLEKHDTFQFIEDGYYDLVGTYLHMRSSGKLRILDDPLRNAVEDFDEKLRDFYRFVSSKTAPEMVAGRLMIGFKTRETVSEELYNKFYRDSRTANDLATSAWSSLEAVSRLVEERIPRALIPNLPPVAWTRSIYRERDQES